MDNFGFFEIFAGILAFFYAVIPSYGLAIILLTLTTRIVLLPLSIKQTRSMREMQVIQPQVKALQKKHKGDRQKLNEEMMKLYKEHGVNPLGGCMPLLLQFPVLIALYQVILNPLKYLGDTLLANDMQSHAARVNSFLGISLDCSPATSYDAAAKCGSGLDIWPYALLLAAMGFTTWYQQKQMQASRGSDQAAQQMQMMGRIMPVLLVVIGFGFPAGVLIYWFASNLWTIVQQRIILKAAPPLVGAGDGADKGGGKAAAGKTKAASGKGATAKATSSKPSSAKGNGAARPKSSKPHPSSKKKKR